MRHPGMVVIPCRQSDVTPSAIGGFE